MRRTGHKMDYELLKSDFELSKEQVDGNASDRRQAERDKDAYYFKTAAEDSIEYLRLAYLFDVPIAEIREILMKYLPDLQRAIEFGYAFEPNYVPTYIGAVFVVGDDKLAKWIARLSRDAYNNPDVLVSEAQFAFIKALQAGILVNQTALSEAVSEFKAIITPKRLVSPREEKVIYESLAALLAAIAEKDQKSFDEAWNNQAATWKKRYNKSAELANFDAILDVEALGIAAIAQRFGLTVKDTNAYAPIELIPVPVASKRV